MPPVASFLLTSSTMDVLREYGGTSQSARPNLESVVGAARAWLASVLQLAMLEGRQAALGLALILGFAVGAMILLVSGWLALVACAVAALVEHDVLGWTGSLLLAAFASFAGAGGLVFLAYLRTRTAWFEATRRQLGLQAKAPASDG
jgi:hypothetical protein